MLLGVRLVRLQVRRDRHRARMEHSTARLPDLRRIRIVVPCTLRRALRGAASPHASSTLSRVPPVHILVSLPLSFPIPFALPIPISLPLAVALFTLILPVTVPFVLVPFSLVRGRVEPDRRARAAREDRSSRATTRAGHRSQRDRDRTHADADSTRAGCTALRLRDRTKGHWDGHWEGCGCIKGLRRPLANADVFADADFDALVCERT